jgi:hypothetical protein
VLVAEGQAQTLEKVDEQDLAQELFCGVHLFLVYSLRALQVKRRA